MRHVSRDHVALGRAIRAQRVELHLTQQDVADRCGLHRTYVAAVERGERNLAYTNLLKIARALGVRATDLVEPAERATRRTRTRQGGPVTVPPP